MDELAISLTGADGARALPEGLRDRLRLVLSSPAAVIGEELRDSDVARPVPPSLRGRLERTLEGERRRAKRSWRLLVLAPAAVIATGAAALGLYRATLDAPPSRQEGGSLLPAIVERPAPPPAPPVPSVVRRPARPPAGASPPKVHEDPPPSNPGPDMVLPPEPPVLAPDPPEPPACGPAGGVAASVAGLLPPPLGGEAGVVQDLACAVS